MTATKTRRPAAPITVKKGKPSASGEVIDTSKIPASPEVRVAEDTAKHKAKLDETIGKAVAKMTGRDEGAAAASAKKSSTKAKEASVHRLTTEWVGKDKKDVAVKDRVKTSDGIVIDVIGRWTKKAKDGKLIPMVTGQIVTLPTGGNTTDDKSKGRKIGDRQNAAAAACTHVKK